MNTNKNDKNFVSEAFDCNFIIVISQFSTSNTGFIITIFLHKNVLTAP